MVEFAVCISLFLLILFAVIDFGRLGYSWVVAEKAMQRATRIATVRPAVCTGVPLNHLRADPTDRTHNPGTLCREVAGLCVGVSADPCLLSEAVADTPAEDTADEMWAVLQNLLPPGASRANVLMRYEYDSRLGFLGGPYVPIVTAELVGGFNNGNVTPYYFEFVTPLSALAGTAGAANAATILPNSGCAGQEGCIPFPAISVTLPGEDLNNGVEG